MSPPPVRVDEKAIQFLIQNGFNQDYGARPLRRAIERFIEDPLAEEVLRMGEDIKKSIQISVEGELSEAKGLSFDSRELEPFAYLANTAWTPR